MKRFLITGFSGFVGRYFVQLLEEMKKNCSVLGMDLNPPEFDTAQYKYAKCSFRQINLLDREQLETAVFQFQPDYILHLASFSSVGYSWKNPVQSFSHNTNIFLNLLEVVRSLNIHCRILSVGSSEEYGNVSEKDLPLIESYPANPVSPYAVARVAQEQLSKVYVNGYNLDIVMTRSFNHFGAYQKDIFVIPSFARQLVELSKIQKEGRMTTGDINIIRDFVDVRDVVRAYYDLFEKGAKGEIYNICSNTGTALKDIIEKMADILEIKVNIDINPDFIRPNDNKIIIGSNQKLQTATGWKPQFSIDQSLSDIINYWKQQTVGDMNTTKPKIAIIGRGLENGGVLRYLHNLLLELDKCQTLDFYFIHTERIIQIDFKNIKSIYVETKSKLWFDYVTSFFLVKKYKFDLVIYPKNVIPTTHYLLSCKKMNVVYDLGYFEKSLNAYPFLDTLFMTTFMKQSCKGADATISISQSTKDDIVKRFGTKSEKINPILLAVEDNFKVIPETQADKQFFDKLNIKKPYLFFAGSVNPRKNMERTIKAFMSIADKIPHTIVMTGFNNWTSEEELYKNPRIQMVGFRSEEELITLYNHADLFLYASLYEGFGLPIIEAQACGCPVLTSNVTSCPEVAGDSALIVNPYSVEEIADGILKILTDEEYRQKLIHLGFENLKRFSWEKNAQQTIELIHSLVG